MQHDKTWCDANNPAPTAAHILLVEDDVALRDMLITALKAEGFTTTHARSLAAAHAILAAAAGMSELPQAVLLDLHLPDGHGGQLFTRWQRGTTNMKKPRC
jgi:DNA-binding response OmpR family regulator